jgi:hypothetical protein
MLFLRHRRDTRGLVKHHESRARRALIDCSNVVFHRTDPSYRRSSILRHSHPLLHANSHPSHAMADAMPAFKLEFGLPHMSAKPISASNSRRIRKKEKQ